MEKQIEYILRGSQLKQLVEKEMAGIREQYGLKRIEIEIIYFLSKCGDNNTLADICKSLNANKGHISQAVDTLYKKGYLTAEHDKKDRRYVHYTLTDAADRLTCQTNSAWDKLRIEIFAGIPEEELNSFKDTAEKIMENMNRLLEG